MHIWYDYRTAWSAQPWILGYAIVVVVVFALAVVGTFIGGPLAILFIPSLVGAYAHHVLVRRQLAR